MSTATEQLTELSADEVVTHSYVRDVPLPSGGVLALITLDNGRDHTRPSTLGPATLHEFGATLDAVRSRASSGEIAAIAVTGKPYFLAAGADLSKVSAIPSREVARELATGQSVRYAELTCTPVTSLRQGITIEGYTEALEDARVAAERDFGIVLRWIYDIPGESGLPSAEAFAEIHSNL